VMRDSQQPADNKPSIANTLLPASALMPFKMARELAISYQQQGRASN